MYKRQVLDTVDFDRRAVGCDLVVTGEGSFDAQSLGGKAISLSLIHICDNSCMEAYYDYF